MNTSELRRDIHREITDRIVAAMERGAAAFEMPWHRGGITQGRPANALSRHPYRGVNVLVLWVAAEVHGYRSGYWGTYNHWKALGAQVRKGEKASFVVFYKEAARNAQEKEEEQTEETGKIIYLLARSFRVFNADQVRGWVPPEQTRKGEAEVLRQADEFVRQTGAVIRHGGDIASYQPTGDYIAMPDHSRFRGTNAGSATEGYYATLFHELTHWTAHRDRMDRDLTGRFGDNAYAMEELVAELGAAFLCADLCVSNTPRADHAGYLANWLEVLKSDKKAIFTAASRAHQATEYLASLRQEKGVQDEN